MAFSQGWPTLSTSEELRELLPFDISQMSQCLGKSTLGNGMHLVAEESWFCFVASHAIRRDVVAKLSPPINFEWKSPEDDD
eukprot:9324958-Pyramimonas_sp.AAC.1